MYDLVIIGGGIAGLGILKAACAKGLSALLLEKGSIGSATSSASLRIMHGGFRYLQHGDLPRILESIDAQSELFKLYPGLISPLLCALPLVRHGLKSRYPLQIAATLYRQILRFRAGIETWNSFVEDAATFHRNCSRLSHKAPHGAFYWSDALLREPAELHKTVGEQCLAQGGVILEHAPAVSCTLLDDGSCTVAFLQKSERQDLRSRVVINCAGLGSDQIQFSGALTKPLYDGGWCRAFNLTISKSYSSSIAFAVSSSDGRLFFCVPRGDTAMALGTEYLPYRRGEEYAITESECSFFQSTAAQALGIPELVRHNSSCESGMLPVLSEGSIMLRKRPFIARIRGYIEYIPVKYTTFLTQGRYLVDSIVTPYLA
jgi:glycerol-3-phosphate dehydrogenase